MAGPSALPPPPPAAVRDEPAPPAGAGIADRRAEFARLTAGSRQDPAAERAFIESKIEMIRTDPRLSDAEKEAAAAELRRRVPPR